jgi:hypothetical protein
VTASSFLITGLPRCRTTWLAVLFNTLGIDTRHERSSFSSFADLSDWLSQGTRVKPHGLVDGFASIAYPTYALDAFAEAPIVVIERDFSEAVQSWQNWSGHTLDQTAVDRLKTNHAKFVLAEPGFKVRYTDLDDYDTVQKLVHYCTGQSLPRPLFDFLNTTKIELHLPKCRKHTLPQEFMAIE